MTASKPHFSGDLPPDAGPVPPKVSEALQAAAADEERGERPIALSIDLLRKADLLTDDGAKDPTRTARALMRIGAANLGVGRLFEGHVNALHLIRLYGTEAQGQDVARHISNGAFLGVWGADGNVPVTGGTGKTLAGRKCFASGLGTVSHALVTVNSGPNVRLALVDVSDITRADPSAWDMLGMRATVSGTYDVSGLSDDKVEWIGVPGKYLQEPHFVGGVWRIAALQVGAATGLLDMAASELRAIDRMHAEAQQTRMMTALMRAWAGMVLTERSAQATTETGILPEDIVTSSIAARLFTEEVGLNAIRVVEQSIGLRHFEAGSQTGRMARDLSVYLRQAARDAFLQRAAQTTLGEPGKIWGMFG